MREDEKFKLEKKILNEAKRTGFLFEIDVQNHFDKKRWFTRPNARFITEDGEVEIDLLTHKTLSGKGSDFNSLDIICSCKKSEANPWVFYLIKRNVLDYPSNIIKFTSNCGAVGITPLVSPSIRYHLNYDIKIDDLDINDFKFRGKTYYLAFSDPKNKKSRQIYESITGIIKYFKYKLERERERNKEGRTSQKINTLYCPIIVLDGKLFGITNEGGNVKIKEQKSIPLIIETGEVYLDKILIYVVRKDYLEKFIIKLEKDLDLFHKKINLFLKNKIVEGGLK